MAIPKFLQDLAIISKLGDNPGTDNGLSSAGLRAKFDEAGIAIQNYINNTLIPGISGLANPEEGLNMKNNISMGGHRVTGLGDPQADGDALPLGFANGKFAPATESSAYPGCYYRMIGDEQEWINPPLVLGVEYRTVRRINGKPVYTKFFNMGSFSVGETSVKIADNVGTWAHIVAITDGSGNDITISGYINNARTNAGNIVINMSTAATLLAVVEYVKSTD